MSSGLRAPIRSTTRPIARARRASSTVESPAAAARGRGRPRRPRRPCPAASSTGQPLTERPAHAEHVARRQPGQRLGHLADGADRVDQPPGLGRVAADADRHLADAEGVEHVELPGQELEAAGAGSISSVHTSAPSRCVARDASRKRGTIGSGGAIVSGSARRCHRHRAVWRRVAWKRSTRTGTKRSIMVVAERRDPRRTSAAGSARRCRWRAPARAPARSMSSGTAGSARTCRRRRPRPGSGR